MVKVGIFWVVTIGQNKNAIIGIRKNVSYDEADSLGFINYPLSHFNKWDSVRGNIEEDCYYYPRGRVIYSIKERMHIIYADRCVSRRALDNIIKLFDIKRYKLCHDEHYVCHSCSGKAAADELDYRIIRGQDKVGGNLLELTCGATKILVELGKELGSDNRLTEIEKYVVTQKYDAVIISHYHDDHAGLLDKKPNTTVYMGKATKRIMDALAKYHETSTAKNYRCYTDGKTFKIGSISITPFLCDHSAYDSYMLLFEAGKKSILYTGDFRFSGRKSKERLLNSLPNKVTTLIYDGTNIGRQSDGFTEAKLEDRAYDLMKTCDKPVFIIQSCTNFDRLVSFYKASRRARRPLYMEYYNVVLANAAGGKIPRPDVFADIFAFTCRPLHGERYQYFKSIGQKAGLFRITANNKFTMIVRSSMFGYIKRLGNAIDLNNAILIYSMWEGYKQNAEMDRFLNNIQSMGIKIVSLHTSGHACAQDIQLLKDRVLADEEVIIHTNQNTQ